MSSGTCSSSGPKSSLVSARPQPLSSFGTSDFGTTSGFHHLSHHIHAAFHLSYTMLYFSSYTYIMVYIYILLSLVDLLQTMNERNSMSTCGNLFIRLLH